MILKNKSKKNSKLRSAEGETNYSAINRITQIINSLSSSPNIVTAVHTILLLPPKQADEPANLKIELANNY